MKIGEVARAAGVRIDTVRYYERRGLIASPPRRPSGYRVYADDVVGQIQFIKKAQDLGFTLDQIADLISLKEAKGNRCGPVRRLAEQKLEDVDAKIKALRSMRRALAGLVESCRANGRAANCPTIESLSDR